MAQLGYQALSEGFKSGVGMVNLPAQEQARTQILTEQAKSLSTKVESDKMVLDKQKQEAASEMAANARLLKIQGENTQEDFKTKQGQYTLFEKAKQSTSNPEEIERFQKKQDALKLSMDNDVINTEKVRVAQATGNFATVQEALSLGREGVPKLRQLSESTTNPSFGKLADILEDVAPIPGLKKTYSTASAEEKEDFHIKVARMLSPAKDTTAHNMATEQAALKRIEAYDRAAQLRAATETTKLARKQLASTKRTELLTREEITFNNTKQKLEDQLAKIRQDAPTIIQQEPGMFFGTNDVEVPNPLIAIKEAQLVTLQTSYEKFLERMDEEEEIKTGLPDEESLSSTKKTVIKGTKENPIVLE